MNPRSIRYALLVVLFVCTLAFQITVSLHELKTIWSQARQFETSLLPSWAILLNLHVVTPFACLLLGFYVAGVRIWNPKAWLLLAVLVSFSLVSDGSNIHDQVMDWHTPLKHLALVYRSVLINAWPLCMLLFAIYFPERAQFDRRHPALKWAILIPALAVFVSAVVVRVANNEGIPAAIPQPFGFLSGFGRQMLYLLLACFLGILLWKWAIAHEHDERRRLQILFSGLGLSFVPAILLEIVVRDVMRINDTDQVFGWITLPFFTAVVLSRLPLPT